ncbi:hypothetical protein DS838_003006 [Geotrichum bryndzae]|nr:hypothetical protein DS838_003006 [Geotrichum bryndzae]
MRGHGKGYIYSLSFSKEGSVLVSSGSDNTVRVWDVKRNTGQQNAIEVIASDHISTSGGKEVNGTAGSIPESKKKEIVATTDHLLVYNTKNTPVYKVQFTNRNLCIAGEFAIDAAKAALDKPLLNQYAPAKGLPSLRNALANAYSKSFQRELNPETEILVTAGANEGMYSAFTAFLDQGDEAIVFEPFFDQYISNIELPGGVVKSVPLTPPSNDGTDIVSSSEWKLDFEQLENTITERTKMIVLNTPHNPIGKVFSKEELLKIGELAVKHNIIILSDEVYDSLYYTDSFNRIATLTPELARLTLTVGSAGKTFSATGWRVGWVIGHPELLKHVTAAHTRIVFTVNSPLQQATADAFNQAQTNTYFKDNVESFKKKYAIFNTVWDELGLPYTVPDGGYFLLVNFNKVDFESVEKTVEFPEDIKNRPKDFKLAYWLIQEFGIVSIPTSEFYGKENEHMGENYLRFAVCKDDHLLEEAVIKLRGLKKYIKN